MDKKLVLGTAQIGMNYGITNSKGKVKTNEAYQILDKAYSLGIRELDTAQSYGDAEFTIGAINNKSNRFLINTKITFEENEFEAQKSTESMYKKLYKSLKNINQQKINSLMIHNGSLINHKSIGLIEWSKELKKNNLINSFGASIYEDSEIPEAILENLDFLQVPYSIFNQDFEKSNLFKNCLEIDIKLQVRSIFCQGIVLCEKDYLPEWLNENDRKILDTFHILINNSTYSKLDFACSFIKDKDWINSIVIGVTSINELIEIINTFNMREKIENKEIINLCNCLSKKIKDPRNW